MKSLTVLLLVAIVMTARSQDINITKGWKFKTGDQMQWASPNLNDSDWEPIEVGKPWELQGHTGYNGYAWYRLRVVIPSSIKAKAFLKEKIHIDLGEIDDGDEVYLNGSLIGRNAGQGSDIRQGNYSLQRSYQLPIADSRIFWDKENVIAVRVYDSGGDGGMFTGKYGISMMDVTDYVEINANDHNFQFPAKGKISKKITIRSSSDKYDFNGKLQILISDPANDSTIFKQTIGVDFARDRPFEYTYKASLPQTKSYLVTYRFEEDRSKKIVSATEGIPYLLTPPTPETPRINGPAVYGVRPGSPFLFRIPATGKKPLIYEAAGLPAGLVLDKQTGIITGSLSEKGQYTVKLVVKNSLASASRSFRILCGDQIGLTPALGWNSWNCWGLTVNDEKVKASARVMHEKLADHGWAYINIDDGWEDKRNSNGEMLPNSKFPDMKGLTDYVHSLGLKVGIYSSPGPQTCGGFAGSYQHEEQDAKTYGAWGFDYLKYDWCSYGNVAPAQPSLEEYKKPYLVMGAGLAKAGRDILFSFCQYGMGEVWKWGAEAGGNSWRTTGDINDSWGSLSGIGFTQNTASPYAGPGHFNDPDMLVVGKVGWGPSLHNTRLTPDEQYTHISLWALLASPLLIGCDMSQLDDFTLNLLTNDEVLAVDQDALGRGADKIYEKDHLQVWEKELSDGSHALGIFNLGEKAAQAVIPLSDLHLAAQAQLRDLWRQQDLGVVKTAYRGAIPAHGVVFLKAKAAGNRK